MIICPNCQEEIEDNSHYCDQCGQILRYCNRCGRVGVGRRCTSCGGLMLTPEDMQKKGMGNTAYSFSTGTDSNAVPLGEPSLSQPAIQSAGARVGGVSSLTLTNTSLGIYIEAVNGAVIGRKQGPYTQFFQNNMYVSGVHAQFYYKAETGWRIVDKHSSNGTKLNNHPLQPDVEMSLKDGDIIMIANVNLQVSIK